MPKNFKKLVREQRAKTGQSHQAAVRSVRARLPHPGPPAPPEIDDGGWADDVRTIGHPLIATMFAGWNQVFGSSTLFVLTAVAEGVTTEGIELELAHQFGRSGAVSLGRSPLPRSRAKIAEHLAAAAGHVGQEPPRTFGDLLRLLVRLGVVTEDDGNHTVAFPPPAPEETLPLTPRQRFNVLRFRTYNPGRGDATLLDECITAAGPDFKPPAWMRTVMEQPDLSLVEPVEQFERAERAKEKAASAQLELKGIGRAVYTAAEACPMPRLTRLALRVLASRCDDSGHVAMSVAELTRRTGVGHSAFRRLQDLGWLEFVMDESGSRPRTYALVIPTRTAPREVATAATS